MGQFSYKAVDKGGGHVAGTIEAVDRRSAVVALGEKGHFVTELAEVTQAAAATGQQKAGLDLSQLMKLGSRRVNSKDILAITTQLSTALRAGLPLLNALELIRQQQHKAATKEMLGELVDAVSSGQSLSEAMSKHGKTFSPLYLSMIRVGETGGILEQTTAQLAGILSRDDKIKTNMKNASAYPIFVLCVGLASVVIIITWILPRIIGTIEGSGVLLPWPTRMLMATSRFTGALFTTVYGWFFLALLVAGLYYARKWTKSVGRTKWDTFKLRG